MVFRKCIVRSVEVYAAVAILWAVAGDSRNKNATADAAALMRAEPFSSQRNLGACLVVCPLTETYYFNQGYRQN